MGRFALVVFDLDGTLVDSGSDVVGSELHAFATLGITCPGEEWARQRLGTPLEELLAEALGAPPSAALSERFVAAYREHHYGALYPGSRAFPGTATTLTRLAASTKLAVATTRPSEAARHLLQHLGLLSWFCRVQGTDPGLPHKPDPAILHLLLAELALSPAEALMVGDTDRDVAAGLAAGMVTALVDRHAGTNGVKRGREHYRLRELDELVGLVDA
ncbi:MAG: HAD family hydrolase [Myxococcota bacterium]|jgi:phosphoglycolate phosphatase|nr:HAD family hydrolase [Myxococcota bacterium]